MIPEGIPGYMASHELAVLCALASTVPDGGMWVEIGSYAGRSLLAAGKGLRPGCRILSVDDLRGVDGPIDDAIFRSLAEVVRHLGQSLASVHHLATSSPEAASLLRDNSVHAVFIDGSHDYPSVRADLQAWLPKVAPGGFIAGHDYDQPDVRRAVSEVLPGAVHIHATTLWKWQQP